MLELRRLGVISCALISIGSLVAAACAPGDRSSGPPQVYDTPPAWLDTASFAGLGDDLAAIGDATGDEPPQARRPDGSWVELPILPRAGRFSAASVGETVLAAGTLCSTDEECEHGTFRMYLLSGDRSRWTALNGPNVPDMGNAEFYVAPSHGARALLFIDDGYHAVDDAGLVTKLDRPDDADTGTPCIAGDTAVWSTRHDEPAVHTLDLSDPDHRWVAHPPAPPLPADTFTGSEDVLCGPDGVTLVSGTVERSFSVTTQVWTTTPSNVGEVTGGGGAPAGVEQAAWTPDGATAFVPLSSRTLERTAPGQWRDTGHPAAEVVATDAAVLAVTDVPGRAVSQIWPEP